jgi:hypothetical protein
MQRVNPLQSVAIVTQNWLLTTIKLVPNVCIEDRRSLDTKALPVSQKKKVTLTLILHLPCGIEKMH